MTARLSGLLGRAAAWPGPVRKLVTAGSLGIVGGAIFFVLTLAIAVPLLASKGVRDLRVSVPDLMLETVLVTSCFGLLGVALGALTRSAVVSIVGAIVWVTVIEHAVVAPLIPSVAKWVPTSAGECFTTSDPGQASLLPPAVAALVLIGWAVVLSLLAMPMTLGREPR